MFKRFGTKLASIVVVLLLLSFGFLSGEETQKGNVLGFLYDHDGTTPVEGASVKIKNVATGTIYESTASDAYGVFRIEGIESGVYVYGVKTELGEFNSNGIIGLRMAANETAKMAISITPFSTKELSDLKEGLEANSTEGEILVGRILDFNPESQFAEVYVLQEAFSVKDKIRALGIETDFYQDVGILEIEGNTAKTVTAGETAMVKMNESVGAGDFVYLVAERGFSALALIPVGAAALIGGSAAVVSVKKADVNDEVEAVSRFKK